MPRKPSSVFMLVENPASTTQQAGMPATHLMAWRLPLEDDDTVEDVVKRHYAQQQIGSRIYVVEDTKVTGYEVGLHLDEVDDPRLDEDGESSGENGPEFAGSP